MAETYDVLIKAVSLTGKCSRGHKVGDEWVIRDNKTPEGLCVSAFQVMIPNARLLMAGGSIPWSPNPEAHPMCCPDPKNNIVFELRRLPKQSV